MTPERPSRAFQGASESAARWFAEQPGWWSDHYIEAVDKIQRFLSSSRLSLAGRRVVDVGCGDGITALGIAQRTNASHVVGVDLQPVDRSFLERQAKANGVDPSCPSLEFVVSSPECLPLPDTSVDAAITWSVFEHVADTPRLLQEIHRVLVPDGFLFVQVWPFFYSERGSHLWPWFTEPFAHLTMSGEELRTSLRERTQHPELAEAMIDLYESCNRITLDQLGGDLVAAGFYISKVELMTGAFYVPPELQDTPLSLLATAGAQVLCIRH